MEPITYEKSGVSVKKGEDFVEKIKERIESTYNDRVYEGVGGFSALYKMGEDKYLTAGTDGVGTKLKVAQKLNIHSTIGIDLVAMCVNDILCTGSTPLFFMDYLASGKLNIETSKEIINGIVKACKESSMALIGGETAEMPGMYKDDEYDLAGFAVGEINKADLINGSKIKEGNTIIGIASSGLHSNGFSLARKLINEDETELMMNLLTPTRLYTKQVTHLLKQCKENILGLAHITGGGFTNIARINNKFNYIIDNIPLYSEIDSIFTIMKERSNASTKELYRTFNMGIGMIIITDNQEVVSKELKSLNEKFWILGNVYNGAGKVKLSLKDESFFL